MDVTVDVSLCDVLREHIVVYEVLRALGAVLEHSTHRCVSVDVGVLSLDVGILRVRISELIVDVHQIGLSLSDLCVLGTVEDVSLGGLFPVILDEHCLDDILHLLYSACIAVELLYYLLCEIGIVDARHLLALYRLIGSIDGVEDLGLIERHLFAVSFYYAFHGCSLRYIYFLSLIIDRVLSPSFLRRKKMRPCFGHYI